MTSGGRGWTDKVFGLKILPVGWRFFMQNPQGLTLADQSEGLSGARLHSLVFFVFSPSRKLVILNIKECWASKNGGWSCYFNYLKCLLAKDYLEACF